MSSTITLRGVQVELDSDLGRAFITDACRAGEVGHRRLHADGEL